MGIATPSASIGGKVVVVVVVVAEVVVVVAAVVVVVGGSVVVGSEGGVRLDPFGFFRSVGDLDLNSTADLDRFNYRLHNVQEQGDVYDSPQHHWIAAIEGRVELLPTAEIALNCMLISEGIYRSSELGREVTAEEVREMSKSTAVAV